MSRQRRLLAAIGAGVWTALMYAAVAPMAAASPLDCDAGACMSLGGEATDVGYLGFRPFATDWWGNQPVDVMSQHGDVLGSYNVLEQDFLSPLFDASLYHYGNFAPADGSTAADPTGMSGMWLYDVGFGPGLGSAGGAVDASGQAVLLDSLTGLAPDGTYYWVVTGSSGFQNILEISPTNLFGSADFITVPGHDAPIMVWDELPDASVPHVPVLPPDDLITWP